MLLTISPDTGILVFETQYLCLLLQNTGSDSIKHVWDMFQGFRLCNYGFLMTFLASKAFQKHCKLLQVGLEVL